MLMDSSFFEMRSNIDTHLLAINETATAMQSLINDLLDVSAVREGTFKISRQPASLTEVLRQAAQLQQQAAAKKQIVIVERLTTLPIFNLDPSRIRQAVDNLLSNAVKHSPAGSVVVLSVEQAGSAVRVAVADQGPGLSEKELEQLFADPAGPADSRKDSRLGWAVVKKIIELHGGVLRAENQAERGCVFSFTLSVL
jgi:signal transduction histidine kinase